MAEAGIIEDSKKNEEAVNSENMQLGALSWDTQEYALICRVLNSYYAYGLFHHRMVTNSRRRSFFALPARHQAVLLNKNFNFLERFQDIEDAIDTNANCALEILTTGLAWGGFDSLQVNVKAPPKYSNAQVPKTAFAPVETTEEDMTEWSKPNLPRLHGLDQHDNQRPSAEDMSKAASTIRHMYREWSQQGRRERDLCFGPIVHFLVRHFRHVPQFEWHNIKILNPGCGLGRLVFDLACLGFTAEGCEISYHMLTGSMHMMNAVKEKDQYRIYPWVLNSSNHLSHKNRMRSVQVPDVSPPRALAESTEAIQRLANEYLGENAPEIPIDRLGIAAGDFCVVYKGEQYTEAYDVVTTVFFLDTAKNPLAYMEAVNNCLRTGGIWMNLGPLKWHFEAPATHNATPKGDNGTRPSTPSDLGGDSWSEVSDLGIGNPGSVELMEDDVQSLLVEYGFEVIHYDKPSKQKGMGYIWDEEAMETNVYYPSFWVAKKVRNPNVEVGGMPYKSSGKKSTRDGKPLGEGRTEMDLKMTTKQETSWQEKNEYWNPNDGSDAKSNVTERTWSS